MYLSHEIQYYSVILHSYYSHFNTISNQFIIIILMFVYNSLVAGERKGSTEEKEMFHHLKKSGVYVMGKREEIQTYVSMCTWINDEETGYKDIISRCLAMAENNRSTSIHFELRETNIDLNGKYHNF